MGSQINLIEKVTQKEFIIPTNTELYSVFGKELESAIKKNDTATVKKLAKLIAPLILKDKEIQYLDFGHLLDLRDYLVAKKLFEENRRLIIDLENAFYKSLSSKKRREEPTLKLKAYMFWTLVDHRLLDKADRFQKGYITKADRKSDNLELRFAFAEFYRLKNNYSEAMKELNKITKGKEDCRYLFSKQDILFDQGKFNEVITVTNKELGKKRKYPPLCFNTYIFVNALSYLHLNKVNEFQKEKKRFMNPNDQFVKEFKDFLDYRYYKMVGSKDKTIEQAKKILRKTNKHPKLTFRIDELLNIHITALKYGDYNLAKKVEQVLGRLFEGPMENTRNYSFFQELESVRKSLESKKKVQKASVLSKLEGQFGKNFPLVKDLSAVL